MRSQIPYLSDSSTGSRSSDGAETRARKESRGNVSIFYLGCPRTDEWIMEVAIDGKDTFRDRLHRSGLLLSSRVTLREKWLISLQNYSHYFYGSHYFFAVSKKMI